MVGPRVKLVLAAAGLVTAGWTLGTAQTRQPDFEFVIDAAGGQTRVQCVRGCELAWVERGLNPNSRPTATFSFGCSGERCASGRVGGWVTR
jgi:hypothetical protein